MNRQTLTLDHALLVESGGGFPWFRRLASLQWQFGLLVFGGLFMLYSLFVVLGAFHAEESSRLMRAARLQTVELTVAFLDRKLGEQFALLDWFAEVIASHTDEVIDEHVLARVFVNSPESFVVGAFLTDRAGRLIWAEPPVWAEVGEDLGERQYVYEPLATGLRYASGVQGNWSGAATVVLSAPVHNAEGEPVGVVGFIVDPRQGLTDVIIDAASYIGPLGHAELIDQDVRVIFSTDLRRTFGPSDHDSYYRPLLSQRVASVGTTDLIAFEQSPDLGQRHVMAFAPLKNVPWGLGLGDSEQTFTTPADRWRTYSLLLGGLALIVPLFLVWVTRRSVVGPIRLLTQASQQMADGDLTTTVPRLGRGEVRELAAAFEAMRRRLQQAYDALAVQKSRYQGVVDMMADAVVTVDQEGLITSFNPAAETLTGQQTEEVLGQPCRDVLRPDCACHDAPPRGVCMHPANDPMRSRTPSLQARAIERATQDDTPEVSRTTIRTVDGRAPTVEITRSPIVDSAGTARSHVYVLRDVSAEDEVRRLKDEFLANVSHELRSPLGHIKGYTTTLLLPDTSWDDATIRRSLWVICDATARLEELVDNLLDMSKMRAGSFSVDPQPIMLRALTRTAFKRAAIHAKGHHLRLEMPSGLPRVSADGVRIEQVLFNLIDNAIKYGSSGGDIIITGEVAGSDLVVSVIDDGPGIPPEELESVFERFQRGSPASTRKVSGTGLGLVICRGIVQAHGGKIWAESPVLGRPKGSSAGTAIRFTLPISKISKNGDQRTRHRNDDVCSTEAS